MSMIMASIPIVYQLLKESALCNGDSVLKANYTEHDRSVLCDIDPDINYYHNDGIKSEYYTENNLIIPFRITITCLSFT